MIPESEGAKVSLSRKPRASGDDPGLQDLGGHDDDVNPARAGMIPAGSLLDGRTRGKPRASGDDPIDDMTLIETKT